MKHQIAELAEEMSAVRRDIHQHPELAFRENRTAAVVTRLLRQWGISVHEGIGRTGIVGVISAGDSNRSIGLRADMDALPIQETTSAPHSSVNAGVAHSCGHDGHTAMLLCAARYLAQTKRFNGRVHLIFQPAEEGEAGALAMIEDGLFERFPCEEVYALHNWPSLPVGVIATRPGPIMAAADRFDITVSGGATHAAQPHRGTDTILCAANIITSANTLVARRIDPAANAVLSVTCVHGGSAHNALPAKVLLTGTVRTFDPLVQDILEEALRQCVKHIASAFGCTATIEYKRYYPATINDAGSAMFALDAARAISAQAQIAEAPAATSEDFAFMLQRVPGAYIWLGSGDAAHDRPLHDPAYDFNDEILPIGAALLASLAERRLQALGDPAP